MVPQTGPRLLTLKNLAIREANKSIDLAAADAEWTITALRYFNPIGCDESGLLGEDPRAAASNLMPSQFPLEWIRKSYRLTPEYSRFESLNRRYAYFEHM